MTAMTGDDAGTVGVPRVAVIDDEEDITTFLRLALEDAGFVVVASNHPEEAPGLLRAFQPDVICLDLLMPGLTGASLYVEIKADPELARVPVLILSGLNARDELTAILAREGGVPPPAGYIEKPVAAAGFVRIVRSLLAAPRATPVDTARGSRDRESRRGGGA
jgi:DNA-binding response OmpR family regulator